MSRLRLNIDEFLNRARVALNNARQTPEILAALTRFGYDETRLKVGADLLARAESQHAIQQKEYGEQYAATTALNQTWQAANDLYTTHRKLAQLACKKDIKQQRALGLADPQKRSLSGWLGQATIFYTNALNTPEVQTALARFNITVDNLKQGQELVQQVANLNSAQEQEKYEAQQATQSRDTTLDELDEWLADFKEVALIALVANPQQLEALQF